MVTRDFLTKVLGLLVVAATVGALPGSALPADLCGSTGLVGVNPVVNGAMTLGLEREPASDGLVGGLAQEAAGALGVTEAYAYHGALGWTVSLSDDSRLPHSDAGWSDHHGTANSGVLWVHYDARDADNGSIAIRQVLGDAGAGGAFCHADEVTLDVVSDGPVDLAVAVHTAERPDAPYFSEVVRVGLDGGQGHPAMPPGAPFVAPWAEELILDVDAVGTLTMVEILIEDVGAGASDDSWVFVDNVAIFGTSTVSVPN